MAPKRIAVIATIYRYLSHAQHFADGAFIVGSTKDGLSDGASVHKVNTTPYHLGIHLERSETAHLSGLLGAVVSVASCPM